MILDCHTHIFPAEMIRDRDALCGKDKGFAAIYESAGSMVFLTLNLRYCCLAPGLGIGS
jgi:hypothetical protein